MEPPDHIFHWLLGTMGPPDPISYRHLGTPEPLDPICYLLLGTLGPPEPHVLWADRRHGAAGPHFFIGFSVPWGRRTPFFNRLLGTMGPPDPIFPSTLGDWVLVLNRQRWVLLPSSLPSSPSSSSPPLLAPPCSSLLLPAPPCSTFPGPAECAKRLNNYKSINKLIISLKCFFFFESSAKWRTWGGQTHQMGTGKTRSM